MEDRVDVSRTMQHTDDIDPVITRYVENNVTPNWKAAHTWRQFVAGSAQLRLRSQHLELRVELVHPAIGGGRIVVGNEVPDFQDIGLCKRPSPDMRHSSSRRFGCSSGARFALDHIGIPGFARPAGHPPTDIATQLFELCLPQAILLIHQSQRLAHDFAGRRVQPGSDFRPDKVFQLRRQVDIHSHGVLVTESEQEKSYQEMSKMDISSSRSTMEPFCLKRVF